MGTLFILWTDTNDGPRDPTHAAADADALSDAEDD